MLRFWKVSLANFKIGKPFRYFSNFKYSGVICEYIWFKGKLIKKKSFSEEFYQIKKQEEYKNALSSWKNALR